MNGVRRIVVLRGGGLGDIVFVLPALEALRAAFEAEITLIGPAGLADLVVGRSAVRGGPPLIDRHLPLPDPVADFLRSGDDPTGEVARFAGAVAALQPDIAIQLHGGGRTSNPLIHSFGAHITAGCRTPDAPAVDHWVRHVEYAHEVFRHLEVVGALGAAPVSVTPRLTVSDAERVEARRIASADPGRPLVVLHPSASDPRRRWPLASYASVGRRLAADGAQVVIVGDEEDRAMTTELTHRIADGSAAGPAAADLGGMLSLPTLAAVLAEADLVIANDSGPLHLARAVGAATIGIFWCGNVINAGAPWRHRHRQAISWRLACSVCGLDCTRETCDHDASFVADVRVDEVLEEACDLLAVAAGPGV